MQWNVRGIDRFLPAKLIAEVTPAFQAASLTCRPPLRAFRLSRMRSVVVVMKKKAIHQNLNTSFVNVTALVRYLRNLQFVGSIRIELSSYEADIVFTSSRVILAREYDHIAGRISQDSDALRRILIRAREPHGRVHVYKAVDGYAGHDNGLVFVDRTIVTKAREMAANTGGKMASTSRYELLVNNAEGENALVVDALSELLRAIDEILAKGKLSFAAAFGIACDAIAPKYPFMSTDSRALRYKNGEIRLNSTADVETVVSAVFAALRPIFSRLRREKKYEGLAGILADRLQKMSREKRNEYDRLSLTGHIEELLDDSKR